MKKLYILILFVTIGLTGFSQTTKYGPDTTLESPAFAPGNVEIIGLQGGGYLTGSGTYDEFYQKYSLMDYAAILGITIDAPAFVDKVYVLYGRRTLGGSPGYVKSSVYSVVYNSDANLDQTLSPTPGYGPDTTGALGTSDSLSMVDITANSSTFLEATLNYPNPVQITNDSFFVSLAFSSSVGDTLVIGGTKPNGTPAPPFPGSSWESVNVSGNNYFYSFQYILGASGYGDIDLGIFPHIMHPSNAGINNVTADNLFVIPFPNPATSTFNILYDISRSESVTITLTDMLGRVVADLGTKTMAPGAHTEQMDVSNLSNGMYIYNVETSSTKSTGKIMVGH